MSYAAGLRSVVALTASKAAAVQMLHRALLQRNEQPTEAADASVAIPAELPSARILFAARRTLIADFTTSTTSLAGVIFGA